tara:strand:- start:3965 stop:4627 length:663 start_codon:yes stop_codon:yes gene_type:complete
MADFNFYEPNWSGMVTGDISSGESADSIFDNNLNTFVSGNPEVTFTIPTGHPFRTSINKLRIYATRYPNGGAGGELIVNGTAVSNVDTATRSWHEVNVSSLTDIKWTKEGGTDSAFSSNSYVLVFAIEINDSVLINLDQLTGGAASGFNTNQLVGTTNTNYVNVTYSSITRATGTASNPNNFNIQDLDDGATGDHSAEKGFLQGRRPHRGLQFPRGYYNK